MSIVSRKEEGEDEKESVLVALLTDQYLRHGFDSPMTREPLLGKNLGKAEKERIIKKAKALAERMQRATEISRPEHAAIELDRKISKVFCCLIVLFLALFPGIIAVVFCFGSIKSVVTSTVTEMMLAAILFCIAYGVTTCILIKRWFAEIDRKACHDDMTAVNKAYNRLMREAEEKKVERPLFLEQGLTAWDRYRDFCDNLNCKREKDRWAEIEQAVPLIPEPPSPPRFIDAVIVMGQKNKRRYAKWLMDFERWVSLQGKYSHGRSEQGKIWSWQDWKWHRLFDEWQAKTLIPELSRINHCLRERFDERKEEMRREYQRRFSRLPSDDEIPIEPPPTVKGENIPDCYGWGHRIIRHDRLQAYIAAVVPPMPKLNNAEAETLRCIASYVRGLEGIGYLSRLIHFVSTFQYHCADKCIPDYGWACIGETGLREVFVAGEIFCCHQQGLLNANIAAATKHYAIIAITTLERDIWQYVETLCLQKPSIFLTQKHSSFELS